MSCDSRILMLSTTLISSSDIFREFTSYRYLFAIYRSVHSDAFLAIFVVSSKYIALLRLAFLHATRENTLSERVQFGLGRIFVTNSLYRNSSSWFALIGSDTEVTIVSRILDIGLSTLIHISEGNKFPFTYQ